MIIHKIQYLRHPFISSKPQSHSTPQSFIIAPCVPFLFPSCSLSFPFSFSCSYSFLSFDFSHIFFIILCSLYFPPSFFLPLLLLELGVEPSVMKSGKNLTDGPCFRRFWTFGAPSVTFSAFFVTDALRSQAAK